MAWFGLGVPEAGGGNALAVGAGAVGEVEASGDVGDAVGLRVGMTPNGLPGSDDALAVGDVVGIACSATLGACRDDQTANAATEPATTTIAAPATITRSRREVIPMPIGTHMASRGYGTATGASPQPGRGNDWSWA